MTETKKPDEVFFKAAKIFLRAGQMPITPSDTLAQMIEVLMTKEQAEFLTIFKKNSYTIDQIKEKAKGYSDEEIQKNRPFLELRDQTAEADFELGMGCSHFYEKMSQGRL